MHRSARQPLTVAPRGVTPRGFTLTELLVSIAIIVVLMAGVAKVFKFTGETVGTGQALNAISRDARSMASLIQTDLSNIVLDDAPFLIIVSERRPAFTDEADLTSDLDFDPASTTPAAVDAAIRSVDFSGNNVETAIAIPILGQRNWRTDKVRFFARGSFSAQAGNDGALIPQIAGDEAVVLWCHLQQPLADFAPANYVGPGPIDVDGTGSVLTPSDNPNNYYVKQWLLGRTCTILIDASQATGLYDLQGNPQDFIFRPATSTSRASPLVTGAVNRNSGTTVGPNGATGTTWPIQYNRFDIAGTSIEGYRRQWLNLSAGTTTFWNVTGGVMYRPNGSLLPSRPLTAAGAAQTNAALVQGCSNFIVEYAGDFITQATNGNITGLNPDGEIDYLIADGVRRIRFYGFPRDVNGDGVILGGSGRNASAYNALVDVIPLRDIRNLLSPASPLTVFAPFERDFPTIKADYTSGTPMATGARYVAAWDASLGPDVPRPKMIRVIMDVLDPLGRVSTPQRYEFISKLP